MGHAPIPWYDSGNMSDGLSIYAKKDIGTHFQELCLATLAGTTKEDAANAAFIVRAVNNHAKLLAALITIEHGLTDKSGDFLAVTDILADQARAVIEEARK